MANAEGITPSRQEVERQLERMITDPLFLARPKQAAIFEYLVRRALDGAELSEKTIFAEFFTDKRYAEATTNVRTTVSHIRKLLAEYYGGDGQYDPVLITLPAPERSTARKKNYKLIRRPDGQAYTPSFAHNPASWMAKELTVAYHLLRGSPAQVDQAMDQLYVACRTDPSHPELTLGTAEAWAVKLLSGAAGGPDRMLVFGPLASLDWVEKAVGPSWRTHYVRALFHFFVEDRKAAAREFDKALKLDRAATITRGGYVEFLFRTGREEQALQLLKMEADEQAGSAPVHANYAVHLARMRRYEDAERVFSRTLLLDPSLWAAHFGLWEMYLAQGKLKQAKKHARIVETIVTPDEFDLLRRKLHGEKQ